MSVVLELHESEVHSVERSQTSLRIWFIWAYLRDISDGDGISEKGMLQDAEIVFGDVRCTQSLILCNGALLDGVVTVDENSYSSIPVPFEAEGQVAAVLLFESGEVLKLTAASISCRARGMPRPRRDL